MARWHAMESTSPEFLPSNAVRPRPKVDAFCGTKNTKIDFGRGFAPDLTG